MSAELILMLGEYVYGIVRNGGELVSAEQIEAKKKQGWEMIPFGTRYLLKDTMDNRAKVEALLKENIRNYRLVDFTTKKLGDETVLKSVIIEVYKKR